MFANLAIDANTFSANQLMHGFFSNRKKKFTDFTSHEHLSFISDIERQNPLLKSIHAQSIQAFATYGNQSGFLLLNNLPIDADLCTTPTKMDEAYNKQTCFSEFWLSTITALMGIQLAYKQMNNGCLYQNICPIEGQENAISSKGAALPLNLHTDLAFHPFSPHFLLLFCLRVAQEGEQVPTIVSSLKNAMSFLTNQELDLLRGKNYMFLLDEAYGLFKDSECSSLIYGDVDDPKIRFEMDMIVGISEEAKSAHRALEKALFQNAVKVFLEPGQMLIIDNRRAVHGRNHFKAKYNGNDRWLQRAYCFTNKAQLLSHSSVKERVIDYDFSRRTDFLTSDNTNTTIRKTIIPYLKFGLFSLFVATAIIGCKISPKK